jgi:formamidopyrimidine-DNA glycosylase
MPELPDVWVYCEKLTSKLGGRELTNLRLASPFLLRTTEPTPSQFIGQTLLQARPVGKRIALQFASGKCLVIHLMVAGRLKWRAAGATLSGKASLLALDFPDATVVLTEQGSKRRASLHLLDTWESALELHAGGIEPLDASLLQFRAALQRENRTLKRALTDQRLVSGIGNAYSDEILFAAELSPVTRTHALSEDDHFRLYAATQITLRAWLRHLRQEAKEGFPEKVTAFRPEMKVHGRYRKPCRTCGTQIQRIRYRDNETNYCPRCQTGGKLLSDRSLSRLLRKDWPRTIDDLEGRTG